MENILVSDVTYEIRLDLYLTNKLGISRSKTQDLIKKNGVLVNGNKVKSSYLLKNNDVISINMDLDDDIVTVNPENIPLDIVYEDDDVIVVNKPNGMVVHPAVGNRNGTLVNALMYHSKNLSDLNGEFRPGIVHRIDAFTTGLIMVAKNNYAHEVLAKQLEKKTTKRKYVALVWGVDLPDTGTIDAPIGRNENDRKKMAVTSINSKNAVTHFRVIKRYKEISLIELQLETGRTHQIRVHMNYIGYPVVNDPVYGKRKLINNEGQCLHAMTLGFVHPTSGKYMEFSCEIPNKFKLILEEIEKVNI